jgi:colanic acid/amylovoran biosynthesis protein
VVTLKIVVVNGFVREAVADAALLSVLVGQLASAFPGAEIVVTTMEPADRRPDFEGYRNIGSARRYGADESVPRYRRAVRKLAVSLVASYWPARSGRPRLAADRLLPAEVRREVQAIRAADLVVAVGGGYLTGTADLSGDLGILNCLWPLRFARRAGKAVFCAPQSYGPFTTRRQRSSARRTLAGVDLLLARESTSIGVLEAIGLPPSLPIQAVDSAFAFRPGEAGAWRDRLGIGADQILVGMTVRQWRNPPQQAGQEAALAELIDHIQADPGRRVILIPMVVSELAGEDDRQTDRRIAAACRGSQPLLFEEFVGHQAVKDLTAALDFMIGMRFHSVIFALTNLVPSIALEYHHKASGIMTELGLQDWVAPFDDLSGPDLIDLFERLLKSAPDYQEQLRHGIPGAIKMAESVRDLMKETYAAGPASKGAR